jgi:2-polyprenyl-3-methyl-5-hydroxy-6-metoxy-1,4-benzoquinol methylase
MLDGPAVDSIERLTEEQLSNQVTPCRVCGAPTYRLGSVYGSYSARHYELSRCGDCRYAFIADPWTELDRIYDDRYYAGQGADPLVDYGYELDQPGRTIRRYEWRGIARVVEHLLGGLAGVRWLDFGCGNGGLIRYLRRHAAVSAFGFEEGSIARRARGLGLPVLSAEELEAQQSSFDVVTAIEVLEHTFDPLGELRRIRRLLRPGGLLFLTTGNAAPFADKLPSWSYVIPEIHVSFFEPVTLEQALRNSGFRPERLDLDGGFDEILKFKVLKNLRVRRRSVLTDLIPAAPLAAAAERKVHLTELPIGWATDAVRPSAS